MLGAGRDRLSERIAALEAALRNLVEGLIETYIGELGGEPAMVMAAQFKDIDAARPAEEER